MRYLYKYVIVGIVLYLSQYSVLLCQTIEYNHCVKETLTNIVACKYPDSLLKIQRNDTVVVGGYRRIYYNSTRLCLMLYANLIYGGLTKIENYKIIPLVGLSNTLDYNDPIWQEAISNLKAVIPLWKLKFTKKNIGSEERVFYIIFRNDDRDHSMILSEQCNLITIRP